MYILNQNITSNELIAKLSSTFDDIKSLKERGVPIERIIIILEVLKDDCLLVKDILNRNYDKNIVDELFSAVDKFIEEIKQEQNTSQYKESMEQTKKQQEEDLNFLLEFSALNTLGKKTL